ncbi:MAG TPA: hypothetical protein VJN18_24555 [Polyangiaceae bacterium]|nr:hypothetical protein [Polyangiaceae bacterium]
MTTKRCVIAICSSTIALVPVGCLPKDTRPPPAEVTLELQLPADVSLTPQADNTSTIQFMTGDWSVQLDRVTVSLGEPEVFADEVCSEYADAPYFRLLELTQPGPQRLGQVWGLHTCKVDYTVETPPLDAVLGAGLTPSDLDFMRNSWVPVSTEDGPRTAQGMATRVRGRASKDALTISFDWGFSDKLEWSQCQREINGEVEPGLPLTSDSKLNVGIDLDPRKLFVRDGMPLLDLVAAADQTSGDANAIVSVNELSAVSVPGRNQNLAEVLRQTGYPALFRYGQGENCKLNDPEF